MTRKPGIGIAGDIFFRATAEAMRSILAENARRKSGPEAGREHCHVELSNLAAEIEGPYLDVSAFLS
jgi:hypothetical protein